MVIHTSGTTGRPKGVLMPEVELRVVAEDGGEAAWDGETIGEIFVSGPNRLTGYLNRPDATAEVLRDGWFSTGDMATRAADGDVRIAGRRSTALIKSGGFKVGAGKTEGAPPKRPRMVHFVPELPPNAMGKVVKQRREAP